MKTIQISAKNVAKAIEMGLQEIGKNQEDVDIKILDEGGFFRKAKIELTYDDGLDENSQTENSTTEVISKIETKSEQKEQKNSQTKNSNNEQSSLEELCTKFLKSLCEKMSIEAQITFSKVENGIVFNASGENVGALIGKRGETLNAIQEILSNVARRNGFKNERVYFDVENYKNRREMALITLGERMAQKAIKIGKPIKLEYMNAYERKIIHTAVANIEGVSTHSEGEEPYRYLVIIPEKIEE